MRIRAGSVAVALTVALAFAPAAASTRAKPSLLVVQLRPVKVLGTAFVPHERVRVTLNIAGEQYRKTVFAGRRGGFVALYSVRAAKCTTIHVLATGSRGSRASLNVPSTCVQ
jgi:hypothetical protein